MLRNFFKITFRNFRKNRSYVFINLIGLGLSIACCIVGYLNFKYSSDYDKNHVNHERIYKVHSYKTVQGQKMPYGIAPMPLGAQIKDRYSEISHVSRYATDGLIFKKDLKVFDQYIAFAEDDFLEMFTFPIKYGSKDAFFDRSNVLITEQVASVYFGDEDPVGETLIVINGDGEEFPMTVGAVFEKIPTNSSLTFRVLTHLDNLERITTRPTNDWSRFVAATWIMTKTDEFPGEVLDDLNENYIEVQNQARNDYQLSDYYFVQLTGLGQHVLSRLLRSNWLNEPPPTPAVIVPFIMAGLMLLIACFNFTNTSIAISSKRLKEIGIRKVMGSNRKQLIFQFMGENFMLSLISMILGVIIASYLVPVYSAMWDFINLELNLLKDPEIFLFLFGLLVITSIVAGGYPSVYISKYQPVKILRGSLSLGGSNLFSKVLLGAQYMLTIIALISSLAFSNNADYQTNYDMGFAKENILAIRVGSNSQYERYSNLIKSDPNIDEVVGTSNHIGWWNYSRTLQSEDMEVEATMMDFSQPYADIMDLKIKEGRFFDPDLYDYDRNNSIVVNETMVEQMGWTEPLGKVVRIDDSTRLNVVGVLKDFYMYGLFDAVRPTGFRLANKDRYNFVIVRSEENPTVLYEQLEEKWYEVAPNDVFNAEFQNEDIGSMVLVNKNISDLFVFLGALALILSSIGLYTLVSLNVIKRIKEIGVRKVLGASLNQILVLMNRQFFWLLLIATVIGASLSYFAIDALMASIFAVYKAISVFTVAAPFILLLAIALAIASTRILKTATRNPVDSLRYE